MISLISNVGMRLALAAILSVCGALFPSTASANADFSIELPCTYMNEKGRHPFGRNHFCMAAQRDVGKCSSRGRREQVVLLFSENSSVVFDLFCDMTATVNGIPAEYSIKAVPGVATTYIVETVEGEFYGFPRISSFRGRSCSGDCSGHQAGYDWAAKHGIVDPKKCGGRSRSFVEGCKAYGEEVR